MKGQYCLHWRECISSCNQDGGSIAQMSELGKLEYWGGGVYPKLLRTTPNELRLRLCPDCAQSYNCEIPNHIEAVQKFWMHPCVTPTCPIRSSVLCSSTSGNAATARPAPHTAIRRSGALWAREVVAHPTHAFYRCGTARTGRSATRNQGWHFEDFLAELSFVQRHYKKLSILALPTSSVSSVSKPPSFPEQRCKKSG